MTKRLNFDPRFNPKLINFPRVSTGKKNQHDRSRQENKNIGKNPNENDIRFCFSFEKVKEKEEFKKNQTHH